MSSGEPAGRETPLGLHPLSRRAFWAYAVLLFVATHWPKLKLPGGEVRSDLFVHFGAFGTWSFLLGASGLLGDWRSPWTLVKALVVGYLYAAFDEGLQIIPALGRTCAWDDYGADCLGITLGVLALAVVVRAVGRREVADPGA